MQHAKKCLLLLIALCMIIVSAGCGSSGGGDKSIAFVSHDEKAGFPGQLCTSLEQAASAQGYTVDFTSAKMDANAQIDQMNEIIEKKPAAIVLLPVDANALKPSIEKANKAGIPVLVTNRDIAGGTVAQVHSDERQAGRVQGEYMAKHLKQGAKIVYFMGESSLVSSQERWAGFKEACLDKRPDIQLLASTDASWSEVEALKSMTLWLRLFPEIDAIVAANDDMALGGVRAMKAAGRFNRGILVCGIDAGDNALKAVAIGDMSLTVKQDADKSAETIMSLIQKMLSSGQATDDEKVPFIAITKDNVAQFH